MQRQRWRQRQRRPLPSQELDQVCAHLEEFNNVAARSRAQLRGDARLHGAPRPRQGTVSQLPGAVSVRLCPGATPVVAADGSGTPRGSGAGLGLIHLIGWMENGGG
ncbi:hypothetical protein chiPu_0023017 [Chiloscyllium punctatum]|uniref:Uncharacterized protein n=1 Tax=Chiloscyllium punctatum TaxID=137246 RepID=A0A401T8W9_CHIPU|nr:hypothetical protein [Chiloscyllium punctatum]